MSRSHLKTFARPGQAKTVQDVHMPFAIEQSPLPNSAGDRFPTKWITEHPPTSDKDLPRQLLQNPLPVGISLVKVRTPNRRILALSLLTKQRPLDGLSTKSAKSYQGHEIAEGTWSCLSAKALSLSWCSFVVFSAPSWISFFRSRPLEHIFFPFAALPG